MSITPHTRLPRLTSARAPLTQSIEVINEHGDRHPVSIPAERALTVYVDKRELVTLMTLGARPELLVLGYLRNQRMVRTVSEVESITVDWDVGVAAVKTRHGVSDIENRTAKRVVTFLRRSEGLCVELPVERDGASILKLAAGEVFTTYEPNPKGPVFRTWLERTVGKDITSRTLDTVKKGAWA